MKERSYFPDGRGPTALCEWLFRYSFVTPQSRRLERLLGEELEECCEADVERRIETLQEYRSAGPTDPSSDVDALKTLGDDTRYEIVHLLSAAERELCVCEINLLVDVSDSAISHALSDLSDAGLVTRRKEGNWRYYRTTARADALLAALDETQEDDG